MRSLLRCAYVLPLLLATAVACGRSEASASDETVTEVRSSTASCSDEGRLVFVRKLDLADENYSASELMLRGFDVTAAGIHLHYVSWAQPKCERTVRSLDLATGARKSEMRMDDSCSFPELPGDLVTIGGVHYVRGGIGKQDRIFRWDAAGRTDVGPLPIGLGHLGELDGRIVSSDTEGNLRTLLPGEATPTKLGDEAIDLPPWGPSIGPEVDGDRIWMVRHSFERGMENEVGFARTSDRKKFCTFPTEHFPGLAGVPVELFAVRGEHLYIAVPQPQTNGAQRLSIVELALRRP